MTTMMNTLLQLGLEAGTIQAARALDRLRQGKARDALKAYPTLLGALEQAERNGSLAAERRRLGGVLTRSTASRDTFGSRSHFHARLP